MFKYMLLFFIFISSSTKSFAWGFWAHQRINRMAVFTLPPEMMGLYKKNIEYLTEHAVDPDKRRGVMPGEDACHFIDIDHYGTYPFPDFPRYWEDAVAKYTEDSLRAYGIVPFHIPVMVKRLTQAFKDKDLNRILKLSADLGHYIGDSHVPLHTTENYNGQMTGQKGIHGFWESRLPELFAEKYNFFVGKAYYIDDVLLEPWSAVLESHHALDSVLGFEKKLTETYPSDKKFGFESRNGVVTRSYSRSFSETYHNMLAGQVERRMRMSILRVGSFWLTAWKNAGSPDLSDLVKKTPAEEKESFKRTLQILDREANIITPREGRAYSRIGSRHFFKYVFNQPETEEEHLCCRRS